MRIFINVFNTAHVYLQDSYNIYIYMCTYIDSKTRLFISKVYFAKSFDALIRHFVTNNVNDYR